MAHFRLEPRSGLRARSWCGDRRGGSPSVSGQARRNGLESTKNTSSPSRLPGVSRRTCSHYLACSSGVGGNGNGGMGRREISDRYEDDDNDGTSLGLKGILVCSAAASSFFLQCGASSAREKVQKPPPKSVSIVIPVLNEASCIKTLLEFLQLLDPSPLEIIVVDGGSTDDTVRVISKLNKKLKKGVTLLKTSLGSRSKQMNFGARMSKGDYIMFLHADTIPPLDTVGILRTVFGRSPRVHLAAFTAIMDHEGKTFWGMSFVHAVKTHLGALIYRPRYFAQGIKIFFGDQAMVVKREAFQAVGGFNESLNIMEDLDLCVKLFLGVKPDPRDESKFTSISSRQAKGMCRVLGKRGKRNLSSGAKFVNIDRCVHTSGRRVAEWGNWNSLKLFLVLCTSYCYGASPRSLNELGNRVYTAIR